MSPSPYIVANTLDEGGRVSMVVSEYLIVALVAYTPKYS